MNDKIFRLYVEKKKEFDVESERVLADLKITLGIEKINSIQIVNRYDIQGIDEYELKKSKSSIFSDPVIDNVYVENIDIHKHNKVFAVDYLPGQYDQRADSTKQCIEILTGKRDVKVKTAKLYIIDGKIDEEELNDIKNYCINKVDSKETSLQKADTLEFKLEKPSNVKCLYGFINMDDKNLKTFLNEEGLAMTFNDLKFCQKYFKSKKRNPTITEIKVIDTYWSDHCRHTTFNTNIEQIRIEEGNLNDPVKDTYEDYLNIRKSLYKVKSKDICLMDIATIGMKKLLQERILQNLDKSDEINACSIDVDVDVDGNIEKWLVMFKNETHNHPTEIEPFGGAATCLGGAIRDPLSGRSYVYQAMRVTGCANPKESIEDTIRGKLPQKKITLSAATGYSSYGNQIGLATGHVSEIYHKGYMAKRMEVGAVVGAVKASNVIREVPKEGDVVILLGGKTGRDGCGGATGASKEHTEKSIVDCSSEVQRGNALTERKIQRLFRNEKVIKMIKRCNDFGAGGVSVAVGELADGLNINLDKVPKKYEGLDGTELAISESQERMAVVISKDNADKFIKFSKEENLEATIIANVTSDKILKMYWNENLIVDLDREFLDSNGAENYTNVEVKLPQNKKCYFHGNKFNHTNIKDVWLEVLKDMNVCSQKGLIERFDSTIGAGTVIMPFGGKYQLTPAEAMVCKIPVLKGNTNTATIMSYGFNPYICDWSPFHGAIYAILESVAKIVSLGGAFKDIRLSFQEYFEKLGKDACKWGKPFAALLGGLKAQIEFNIPAIGGKDSMSGTFKDIHVPPTLISFALCTVNANNVISQDLKKTDSNIIMMYVPRDENYMPDFKVAKDNFNKINELIKEGKVLSSYTIKNGGIIEAISKMAFGNKIGVKFVQDNSFINKDNLTSPNYGSILLEIPKNINIDHYFRGTSYKLLGTTTEDEYFYVCGEKISIKDALNSWENTLEDVFITKPEDISLPIENIKYVINEKKVSILKNNKPKVFIPAFPGTNCEYDSKIAFEKAGADTEIVVFKNNSLNDIEESIEAMSNAIKNCNILMIPGGFSAGDEPDGSAKFIATVFRNEKIKEQVMNLIRVRDGLVLGICNGFQALIKLGLVPYGEIREIDENNPTLTYNKIGRHMSKMVQTKVVSNISPWFNNVDVGDTFTIPVSHGEGRFIASQQLMQQLISNGQIATQYVDFKGNASYDIRFNPNGSYYAVEAITSPDGRILGKMAHSERIGNRVAINILGNKDQKIFEAGVSYFK